MKHKKVSVLIQQSLPEKAQRLKQVMTKITELMSLDDQPFSMVEDQDFI